MKLEDFKEVHGSKSPEVMVDLLIEQMETWGSDKAHYVEALRNRNEKDAQYWHNEMLAMKDRASWLADRIKDALTKKDG